MSINKACMGYSKRDGGLNVKEMKQYLQSRGISGSGKRADLELKLKQLGGNEPEEHRNFESGGFKIKHKTRGGCKAIDNDAVNISHEGVMKRCHLNEKCGSYIYYKNPDVNGWCGRGCGWYCSGDAGYASARPAGCTNAGRPEREHLKHECEGWLVGLKTSKRNQWRGDPSPWDHRRKGKQMILDKSHSSKDQDLAEKTLGPPLTIMTDIPDPRISGEYKLIDEFIWFNEEKQVYLYRDLKFEETLYPRFGRDYRLFSIAREPFVPLGQRLAFIEATVANSFLQVGDILTPVARDKKYPPVINGEVYGVPSYVVRKYGFHFIEHPPLTIMTDIPDPTIDEFSWGLSL